MGNSRLRLQKLEGLRPLENAVEGGVLVVKGLVGLVSIMRPPLVQYFFAVLLRFRRRRLCFGCELELAKSSGRPSGSYVERNCSVWSGVFESAMDVCVGRKQMGSTVLVGFKYFANYVTR